MKIIQFIALACLFACPLPLVISAMGYISHSVWLMLVLATIVPIVLKENKQIKKHLEVEFTNISLIYANILLAAFFFSGGGTVIQLNISEGQTIKLTIIMLLSFLIYEILLVLLARLITKFFTRNKNKNKLITNCLDLIIMTFPIPLASALGLLISILANNSLLEQSSSLVELVLYIVINTRILLIIGLGSIVFYLYPKKEEDYKKIRILRILVTGLLWSFWNIFTEFGGNIYFNGLLAIDKSNLNPTMKSLLGKVLMSTYPISLLVVFIVAIVIGFYLEKYILKHYKNN